MLFKYNTDSDFLAFLNTFRILNEAKVSAASQRFNFDFHCDKPIEGNYKWEFVNTTKKIKSIVYVIL